MKKVISILLVFAVVIGLIVGLMSCNGKTNTDPTTPSTTTPAETEPPMPNNPTLPPLNVEVESPNPDISVDEFLENFEIVDSISKIPEDLLVEHEDVFVKSFEDAISKFHGRLFVVQGITHAYYTTLGDTAYRVVMNKGGWLFMKNRSIVNDVDKVYFYLFDSSLNFTEIVLNIEKGTYNSSIKENCEANGNLYELVNGWEIVREPNGHSATMTYKINDKYFMSVMLKKATNPETQEMISEDSFQALYTKFANSFYVEKLDGELVYDYIEIDHNEARVILANNWHLNYSNKMCMTEWRVGDATNHYANMITLLVPQYNKTYTITEYPAENDLKWFEENSNQNGYTLEKFEYDKITLYKVISSDSKLHSLVIEGEEAIFEISLNNLDATNEETILKEIEFIFKNIFEIY